MRDLIANILYFLAIAAAVLQLVTQSLTDKQAAAVDLAVLKAWDRLDDWKRGSTLEWIRSPVGMVGLLLAAVTMLVVARSAARSQSGPEEWYAFVLTLLYIAIVGKPLITFMMRRSYLPVVVFFVLAVVILVSLKVLMSAELLGFDVGIILWLQLTIATAYLGIVAQHYKIIGRFSLAIVEPVVRWAAQLRGGVLFGLAAVLGATATILKAL